MKYRIYGTKPISVVVLHGGPGGIGEMAPVAEQLSTYCGIIEPFQKQLSIHAELLHLKKLIDLETSPPLVIVGHSFGAWMACFFAAQFPALVRKLILVGCPPFEERYVSLITKTRLARMSPSEVATWDAIKRQLSDPMIVEKPALLDRLGKLCRKIDSFDPIDDEREPPLAADTQVYQHVWAEAQSLRNSGELLQILQKLNCPVVAIQGEFDPHPVEGAFQPLSRTIHCFKGIVLKECGHTPWIERRAKRRLYELLKEEIQARQDQPATRS